MTSGITLRKALALASLSLAPAISCAALDVDSLLSKLARPAPATTPFAEVRYSKLLDKPLVVKGQLEYHEDGALVRAVNDPYRERTEIRGETVTVERVGKTPRHFSLKRAPELRSMLAGFGAVLGGSRASIEQDFNLALKGETDQWQLTMTPKSATVGKYVRDIVIQGRENEPKCIVVTQPDAQSSATQGGVTQSGATQGGATRADVTHGSGTQASVMIVGKAAATALPQPIARDWLNTFCAGRS